ncbi:unnamed protein product [Lactuca virosa]|uniref:Malectin-like domain-containing protein n=1 Tax=Lactuca virosa TaxID=75947 RepID=A0AAU9MA07_9ASTR|nr:unnamed protein product [Lactuca virosa]
MFTFASPLFSLLLLFSTTTTTTSQPYKPTDYFLLNCGSSITTTTSDRLWQTDEHSKFVPYNMTTTSFPSTPYHHDPSVSEIPAFLTSSYVGSILSIAGVQGPPVPQLIKEFIIYVNDTQNLNVTFTPSPNSYAFINGIEIVSLPETLYFKTKNLKYVGQITGPVIAKDTALESIYRLNVGGRQISVNDDTGMYRSWDGDENFIFPRNALGFTPTTQIPITYTAETPKYTAPELVYQTQRSMGTLSTYYNLTWILPVDLGFWYMLRLHFCSIIPQYTFERQMIFEIFINNQTAEDKADLFFWTPGSGYPVFKDYVVFVGNPEGQRSKQDFLASPNPELSPKPPPPRPSSPGEVTTKKTPPYAAIIGGGGSGLALLSALGFIVFRRIRKPVIEKSSSQPKSKKSGQLQSAEQEEDIHPDFNEEYTPHDSPVTPQSSLDSASESEAPQRYRSLADIYEESDELMFLQDEEEPVNFSSASESEEWMEAMKNLPYEEVSLAEWGKSHYRKGTLHEIIDQKLSGEIAPKSLMKFAEVANSCLNEKGCKRPSMDEVVWGLQFALQLQEAAEKTGGIVGEFVLEKQEVLFPMQGESTTTSEGSSRWFRRHGMTSTESSHVGLDSETGFSEMRDLS